jgi:hypothetical protein
VWVGRASGGTSARVCACAVLAQRRKGGAAAGNARRAALLAWRRAPAHFQIPPLAAPSQAALVETVFVLKHLKRPGH